MAEFFAIVSQRSGGKTDLEFAERFMNVSNRSGDGHIDGLIADIYIFPGRGQPFRSDDPCIGGVGRDETY